MFTDVHALKLTCIPYELSSTCTMYLLCGMFIEHSCSVLFVHLLGDCFTVSRLWQQAVLYPSLLT